MSIALYHPEHGYYATRPRRTGRAGDFLTSVDTGPLFGRLLARQFAEMGRVLNAPVRGVPGEAGFDLVEAAAADGQLARDVLEGAADESPDFLDAVRLHLVETSPAARARHADVLGPFATRLSSSSARLPEAVHGVIYANELLDALPVHAVIGTAAGVAERYVALAPGADGAAPVFVEQAGPLSNPAIGRHLASLGVTLEPGQRAEVNLSALAWLTRACSTLHRGFLVLVDYGHEAGALYSPAHGRGTLAAMAGHVTLPAGRHGDAWLEEPGARDITSHVDLTSVRHVAEALGCETLGVLDQTYFLMALAGEPAGREDAPGATAARGPALPDDARSRQAFKSLVMPGGLGSTMKVMVFGRNVGRPALRGLSGPARLT
ncbi:MAG: class I SAM-dependent methyltransferase [Vicinamibacterales bacterium]